MERIFNSWLALRRTDATNKRREQRTQGPWKIHAYMALYTLSFIETKIVHPLRGGMEHRLTVQYYVVL